MKNFKMEKKYIWIGIGVLVVLSTIIAFFVLSGNDSNTPASKAVPQNPVSASSDAATNSDALVIDSGAASSAEGDFATDTSITQPQEQQEKMKYEDADIYEKEGKKYAKTEDGTEVEFSGENMQALMEEYMQVQGTGSEKEKELLDQMQVILDNADEFAQE